MNVLFCLIVHTDKLTIDENQWECIVARVVKTHFWILHQNINVLMWNFFKHLCQYFPVKFRGLNLETMYHYLPGGTKYGTFVGVGKIQKSNNMYQGMLEKCSPGTPKGKSILPRKMYRTNYSKISAKKKKKCKNVMCWCWGNLCPLTSKIFYRDE